MGFVVRGAEGWEIQIVLHHFYIVCGQDSEGPTEGVAGVGCAERGKLSGEFGLGARRLQEPESRWCFFAGVAVGTEICTVREH